MNNKESYSRLIAESTRSLYYLDTSGRLFRVSKHIGASREGIDIPSHHCYKNKNDKKGTVYITSNIGGMKNVALHSLMARTFMRGYDPQKHCVGHRDGNPLNCALDNLYLYTRRSHGKHTGWQSRSKGVIIKEYKQDPVKYRSVREAAKALFCSYQTLLDYLSGTSGPNSVLSVWGRQIYYEGETFEDAKKRRDKAIRAHKAQKKKREGQHNATIKQQA